MADLHSLRRNAETARAIAGAMGLRRHRVFAVVREWSGTHVGDGTYTDTEDELFEAGYSPKVRALSGEELAINGLSSHTYEIGPFTPPWAVGSETGGVEFDDIAPAAIGQTHERFYRIRGEEFGEDGKLFCLADNPGIRNFGYKIRVRPIEDTER